LDKRRCVYLNHATWVALCEPKAVEFLFNPVLQAVGMRKADPEMESSFPVTPHKIPKGKLSYRISAAAFFNNLDIKIQRTFQFNKIVLDRNGMISMRIDSVTVVTRGAR
ncbi:MAG TPA: hypothetical protein VGO43_14400, partial [Pyrinomonadaceae bacterium]|nr:hypothetical protein [Pyrinomonadaceae bacterium]